MPDIFPKAASAGAPQLASPQIFVLLNAVPDPLSGLGREAFHHAACLDFLRPVPVLLTDDGGELSLHVYVGGFVVIVDSLLFQIVVTEGFTVGDDTHVGLVVQNPGDHTVAPFV